MSTILRRKIERRLAKGWTNREVAESLTVSIRTVENVVASLKLETGGHNFKRCDRRLCHGCECAVLVWPCVKCAADAFRKRFPKRRVMA